MARTFIRQETQIRKSGTYTDNTAPSEANYETNAVTVEDDLNSLRSAVHNLLNVQTGNWFDDLNVPSSLETGAKRGVNDLNTALHALEKKRVLRNVTNVGVALAVPASQNYVILTTGKLPSQTTAAVGAVTTLGTVVAFHSGTFGTHSLDEVAGSNALGPKNLVLIVDSSNGDPVMSGDRQVWGLIQSETATDGHTITDTTPYRVQISFVRPNASWSDLEACPVADIESKTIDYATRERVRLADLNEVDFLSGEVADINPDIVAVSRQNAYDNQGTTPVDITGNALLDLEGAGLEWQVRDDAEAILFRIIEGSAGGTSKVAVEDDTDEFDVDAVVSDFLNGIKVDTGASGTTIDIGVTAANTITSGGSLEINSTSADLNLDSGLELNFTDSYRAGSTWSLGDGIALSSSSTEWDNFETAFGEVSLLNAIKQAYDKAHRRVVRANVSVASISANTDVSGPSNDNNIDTDLGDISGGSFLNDYDLFLNGELLEPGADAAANNDYYPGTSLANGQLKFEFVLKTGDKLKLVDFYA